MSSGLTHFRHTSLTFQVHSLPPVPTPCHWLSSLPCSQQLTLYAVAVERKPITVPEPFDLPSHKIGESLKERFQSKVEQTQEEERRKAEFVAKEVGLCFNSGVVLISFGAGKRDQEGPFRASTIQEGTYQCEEHHVMSSVVVTLCVHCTSLGTLPLSLRATDANRVVQVSDFVLNSDTRAQERSLFDKMNNDRLKRQAVIQLSCADNAVEAPAVSHICLAGAPQAR